MTGKEYLDNLEQRLSRYFDTKDLTAESLPFTLIAEMNAADEGYFFLPSIKTYAVKHNEYLYIKHFLEKVAFSNINAYLEYVKEKMKNLKTDTEHMSSLFALIFICENGIDENTLKDLEHYKYHKDYFFTLKGWSDLGIIIVDIQKQCLYYNKSGQKIAKCFEFVPSKK